MAILLAVYSRYAFPTEEGLLEYLGTIPECSGQPIAGRPQSSQDMRGDLYCTLFRLLDDHIDLPDFHILWLPPLMPTLEDELGVKRFQTMVSDEVAFWANYIDQPSFKSNASYEMDAGNGHMIILEGGMTRLNKIFDEGSRAQFAVVPPPTQ